MNHQHYFSPDAILGRSANEMRKRSLAHLFHAVLTNNAAALLPWQEESDLLAKRTGMQPSTPGGLYIAADYLGQRDLTVASGSGGGYLVATKQGFAPGLFGASLIGALPMRPMPLQGNAVMGATSSFATGWHSSESTAPTIADPTFGQRASTPKTVSCFFYLSHVLGRQLSPDGADFVVHQAGQKLGEAAGIALINGSGASGEPAGLLQLAGAVSVSGTTLGWSGVRDMLAAAEGYTAGDLIFVAGVNAAKILRSREKATGSGMVFADGKIDGVPALVSRCVPTDALVLAPWSTVVMSTWGVPEVSISATPSASAFQAGRVGVRLMWSLDFTAEQPGAVTFAKAIT